MNEPATHHDHTEAADLPPGATVRDVDGVACTDRDTLVTLTGKSRKTIDTLAISDPEFPTAAGGRRIDRRWWYPVTAVKAYAQLLAARDEAKKPPPPDTDGDFGEFLDMAGAAEVWHVTYETWRYYVYRSIPRWDAGEPGIVPHPDRGRDRKHPDASSTPKDWRWKRATLINHPRPGRGAGAGRPPATTG